MIARRGMSFQEACRVTLEEFEFYNKAFAIESEEKRHNAAIQSWFNQRVKATKGRGKSVKPAFKKFEDFYNHQAEFNRIFEKPRQEKRVLSMADKNRMLNARKRGNG